MFGLAPGQRQSIVGERKASEAGTGSDSSHCDDQSDSQRLRSRTCRNHGRSSTSARAKLDTMPARDERTRCDQAQRTLEPIRQAARQHHAPTLIERDRDDSLDRSSRDDVGASPGVQRGVLALPHTARRRPVQLVLTELVHQSGERLACSWRYRLDLGSDASERRRGTGAVRNRGPRLQTGRRRVGGRIGRAASEKRRLPADLARSGASRARATTHDDQGDAEQQLQAADASNGRSSGRVNRTISRRAQRLVGCVRRAFAHRDARTVIKSSGRGRPLAAGNVAQLLIGADQVCTRTQRALWGAQILARIK